MENNGYESSPENIVFNSNFDSDKPKSINEDKLLKHTYEEAVSLIGTGKFHLIQLIVCGLCISTFMIETLGISISMVSIKCDLNFTLYEQGVLSSAGFLGIVFSSHATGFLADTWGRNKTLKYSLILATTFSVLSAFATSVWILIVIRFLVGIFITGCQSCVFSYMGEFHSNKTRSQYITLLTMFFAGGAFYYCAFGILILPLQLEFYLGSIKFSSWRLMLIFNALPTLMACISVSLSPESPKYLLLQGKHDESLAILKMIYKFNSGSKKESFPVYFMTLDEESVSDLSKVKGFCDAINLIWLQTKPLFNKANIWCTLNLSVSQFIVFFVSHGSFMWIPQILKALTEYSTTDWTLCSSVRFYNFELNQSKIANEDLELECLPEKRVDTFVLEILVILALAFSLLYFIFSFILDIIGKKRLLLFWMLLCGPAILALIWSRGYTLNMILIFLYMFYGNCAGLNTSIAVGYYPTNISGMAMCLIMMTGRLGAFVGSNVIGIVLDQNCEYLFLILFILVFIVLVLWKFLPDDKKYVKTQSIKCLE